MALLKRRLRLAISLPFGAKPACLSPSTSWTTHGVEKLKNLPYRVVCLHLKRSVDPINPLVKSILKGLIINVHPQMTISDLHSLQYTQQL